MSDWKHNKMVGVIAAVVFVISLVIIVVMVGRVRQQLGKGHTSDEEIKQLEAKYAK